MLCRRNDHLNGRFCDLFATFITEVRVAPRRRTLDIRHMVAPSHFLNGSFTICTSKPLAHRRGRETPHILGQCLHPICLTRCLNSDEPSHECFGPSDKIACWQFLHQVWLQSENGHFIWSTLSWSSLSTNADRRHLRNKLFQHYIITRYFMLFICQFQALDYGVGNRYQELCQVVPAATKKRTRGVYVFRVRHAQGTKYRESAFTNFGANVSRDTGSADRMLTWVKMDA